jgi:hypothetical protein
MDLKKSRYDANGSDASSDDSSSTLGAGLDIEWVKEELARGVYEAIMARRKIGFQTVNTEHVFTTLEDIMEEEEE